MRIKSIGWALGALLATSIASPAAATATFAQFVQALPSVRIFSYTNVTSGPVTANITTASNSNSVLVSALGSLASPTIAKVNLTATSNVLPSLAGPDITQLFSGTMTFTLLAPQIGLSGPSVNALTVTFVNASLTVGVGGSAPTLQANSLAGSSISYDSDFEDFSDATAQDFSLSFSGSSSVLNLLVNRLPNYRVSGSGTFAAEAPVPEPASWTLMILGFGAVGMTLRRRAGMRVSHG